MALPLGCTQLTHTRMHTVPRHACRHDAHRRARTSPRPAMSSLAPTISPLGLTWLLRLHWNLAGDREHLRHSPCSAQSGLRATSTRSRASRPLLVHQIGSSSPSPTPYDQLPPRDHRRDHPLTRAGAPSCSPCAAPARSTLTSTCALRAHSPCPPRCTRTHAVATASRTPVHSTHTALLALTPRSRREQTHTRTTRTHRAQTRV